MRKTLVVALVLTVLAPLLSAGLGAVPDTQAQQSQRDKPPGRAPVPPVEIIADRDGNRIFDNLEARLAAVADHEALPVIVLFDRPAARVDLPALERQLGAFAVRHRYENIPGLATAWTKGQITAASRMPFVRQIEYDMPVQATLDTAPYWFGVNAARAAFSVDGNADESATYSENDIVIAIVDTGIAPNHVDLDGGKIIGWRDFIANGPNPYDDQGHGTHVASIAAGEGQGDPDYTGVAPGAALVGVKVLDSTGSGSESGVVAGVDWVISNIVTYTIRVMNLSLGSPGSSDGTDALSLAMNTAAANGIVPVVAAGNGGPWRNTIGSPAAAANAITVAAMADPGEPAQPGFNLASFSSRGPTADGRTKPDIASPGVAIMAARAGTPNGYVAYSGTSMATPFTAGVVALMLDGDPTLTPAAVKARLQSTAVDWGPGGADNEYGAGRLDAYAAVQAVTPASLAMLPLDEPPPVPPHAFFGGRLRNQGDQAFHDFVVTDASVPLALTLIVRNAACAFLFWGFCWEATIDFDLELYDPNGNFVAYANLPDRQDTINIMPATTGTYRARVYVCSGCGGNDDYWLDVSGATATGAVIPTGTPTATETSTATPTSTETPTPTATPTDTLTPTATGTATATVTPEPTSSPTPTSSATRTSTTTPSSTRTVTPTATPKKPPGRTKRTPTATPAGSYSPAEYWDWWNTPPGAAGEAEDELLLPSDVPLDQTTGY